MALKLMSVLICPAFINSCFIYFPVYFPFYLKIKWWSSYIREFICKSINTDINKIMTGWILCICMCVFKWKCILILISSLISLSVYRARNLSGGSPRPRHAKKIHFIKNMKQYDTRGSRWHACTHTNTLSQSGSIVLLFWSKAAVLIDPEFQQRVLSSGPVCVLTSLTLVPPQWTSSLVFWFFFAVV